MSIYTTVGCDIVKVARITKLLENKSVYEKIFQKSELARFESQHLAGIFAGKESVLKALGIESHRWLDIEIINEKNGKPIVKLANSLHDENIVSMDISISHEDDYAIAFVSVLRKK